MEPWASACSISPSNRKSSCRTRRIGFRFRAESRIQAAQAGGKSGAETCRSRLEIENQYVLTTKALAARIYKLARAQQNLNPLLIFFVALPVCKSAPRALSRTRRIGFRF